MDLDSPAVWLAVGFLGQALFSLRFIVQWIASERQRKSVVPVAFWWFSLCGGATLLTYAIHREDPVFILGQSVGLFVYLRNLYFVRKNEGTAP
ncbi:MAG: lipid-A-disaccharide synthase N-terminal domain-containing protein [Pseudomonadota bacterium]